MLGNVANCYRARIRFKPLRPRQARAALSEIHSRFTQGFETADLRAAKQLLD
jgi:hypothetical protein